MTCGRLVLGIVFFSAVSLAACTSSVTNVQPGTLPPAAVPTPGYPVDGATYSYASKSWGELRPAAPATPIPIPTGYGAQDERITTGAFAGRSDLIDVKTAYRAQSQTETTDEYLQWVPTPDRQALERIGRAFRAKGPVETGSGKTIYSVPADEVQVPFAAGNRWNGAGAYHMVASGADVNDGVQTKWRTDETWNQDGSYARSSLNYPIFILGQNLRSKARVTSDGSSRSTSEQSGYPQVKMSIGVPIQTASGAYVIPIVDFFGNKANIPDWYPGGALPPSPLVSVTVVDRGMKTLPAGCSVPRTLATAGEAIVRTLSQFDPNGIVNLATDAAYYAPGIGMVCDVQSSQASIYGVFAPAAVLAETETLHTTTSLTGLTRNAGSAQARYFADAFPFAAGAALSDTTLRRTRARLDASMRAYERTR